MTVKKRVATLTVSKGTGLFYAQQIRDIFGDDIIAKSYSVEAGNIAEMEHSDLYVMGATSDDVFETVMSYIPEGAEIVIVNVTILKSIVDDLKKLPKGTRALLVNISNNMAVETISELHRLGVTNINFIPIGPNDESPSDIELAITPAESRFVPSTVKETIDIGNRVFTTNTIVEMALKLGFSKFTESDKYSEISSQLSSIDYGIDRLGTLARDLESKLSSLLDFIHIGVIGIDMNNKIFAMNHMAEEIIQEKRGDVIGKTTDEAISCMPLNIYKDKLSKQDTRLINIKGRQVSLSTTPIVQGDRFLGYFAVVQSFSDEEEKQQKLRLQLFSKGHTAKYSFNDIIGECPQMKSVKAVAEKMAQSSASVLIYGESGTGKELFAHAIHKSSKRANMPFIAINCAALPDNLLESELFGYAEGSFTGAKKGGKLGLFEHAHRGTLFLDEIEGMSQNLQVKLLRVLQEKEIIRIGDDRIINIDVRILAASNENIKQMVQEGSFRKDLYYRLNALPINIPPLRERGEDLHLLIDRIKAETSASFEFTKAAKFMLEHHLWDGNIRELRNVIEYLNYVDKPIIDTCDLPPSFYEDDGEEPPERNFRELYCKNYDRYIYVMKKLLEAVRSASALGRSSIAEISRGEGFALSEQEVRTILQNLEKDGYVEMQKGRAGTQLTKKGIATAESLT